jgi:flagellar L-ring protein precursor FlgH
MRLSRILLIGLLLGASTAAWAEKKSKDKSIPSKETTLDRFVREADAHAKEAASDVSPGSLWFAGSRFSDLGQDIRASRIDDVVTIVVSESTSAVANGTTKTSRATAANSSITSLLGQMAATRPLPNLLNMTGQQTLDGTGSTERDTSVTATLTARVTHVLPNNYLIVEGMRTLSVNSETQTITVRGVVRPADLSAGNVVTSDRLGEMEVRVNGKGVVNDAIRRPNFLYRFLLGLLPF